MSSAPEARAGGRARAAAWLLGALLIAPPAIAPLASAAQSPAGSEALATGDPTLDAVAAIAHDMVSRPERCTWLEPLIARLAAARPTLAAELTALCTRPVEVTGDARASVDGVDLAETGGRAWIGPRRLTLARGDQRVQRGLCVATTGAVRVDATVLGSTGGTVAERALAHEVAAFSALEAGDRCTAIAELSAAYAEVPAPGYAFNIALAYAEWPGHCTHARRAFESLLDRCDACAEGPRARERLAELATTCSSTVVVTARTPFVLRIGAQALGESAPDPVRAGLHRAQVTIPSGLQILTAAPAAGGERVLAVALEAGERAELEAGLEVLAADDAWSPARTYAAIGTTGLAVVALGASAILGGAYAGSSDELDALPAQGQREPAVALRARAEEVVSAGNGYRTGVYVALGVGVASAVASALLWLWPSDGAEETP